MAGAAKLRGTPEQRKMSGLLKKIRQQESEEAAMKHALDHLPVAQRVQMENQRIVAEVALNSAAKKTASGVDAIQAAIYKK
jgi:hypothetical protein